MYRLLASIDRSGDHLFDIETEFIVNECGHFRLIKQEDYHRSRPCGRKDYQLLYVAEGCAWFLVDGVDTPAKAGDFIIYSPYYPQQYHYHLKDHADIYWVHFYGSRTEELLSELNLRKNCVLTSQFDPYILKKWIQMIRELALKQTGFQTLVPLYAVEILTLISRLMKPLNTAKIRSQKIIVNAMEYISNEFSRSISIQKLAKHLGVSVCWLNLNFKIYTGLTPMQYAINMRLAHSKELLRTTDYTITEIAQLCGYEDSLYFSRLFKKHTDFSPREYRNRYSLLLNPEYTAISQNS